MLFFISLLVRPILQEVVQVTCQTGLGYEYERKKHHD
jgi:hypothetical protein